MLEPLASSRWDYTTAAHLLNRAGFGGTPAEINHLVALGPDRAVASLVDYENIPDPVANPDWAHPDPDRIKRYQAIRDATTPEAAYGHIILWVRQGDLLPLKFDYYAKSGLLFRQMVLSEYKQLAGRIRATRLEMTSLDKKGTKTVLHIDRMDLRDDIPDTLYNLTNLTK